MEAKDYWGYWITIVQELRVKVNDLERKVADLESKQAAPRTQPVAQQPGSMAELARGAPAQQSAPSDELNEKELAACIALKELGHPVGVEEVNEHLRTTRKVNESMKETLFIRLKGAMEKGYIGFDSKTKKFILLKQDFMVG